MRAVGAVEIPATIDGRPVTSIGDFAFYNCSRLTGVTIPESVISINGRAFYGCSGLTDISIPPRVTRISDEAFRACSGLTDITIQLRALQHHHPIVPDRQNPIVGRKNHVDKPYAALPRFSPQSTLILNARMFR